MRSENLQALVNNSPTTASASSDPRPFPFIPQASLIADRPRPSFRIMPKARRRTSVGKVKRGILPCSYDQGYVRQDLYACTKCTKAANGQLSGFCKGCRATCHADHLDAVFELYTKRSFRCDCGNTRARNKCIIQPDKDDLNIGNEKCYGHNFIGKYCRCDRTYDYRLAMAQCAMCEDWFHESCYKTDAVRRDSHLDPSDLPEEYELTCLNCVSALPVLAEYYEQYNIWDDNKSSMPRPGKNSVCTRPRNTNFALKPGAIDFLWRPRFRRALCRCTECRKLYDAARASYIIDRGDFVGAPAQDDLTFLNATDDAEIVSDVMDAEERPSRKRRRSDDVIDVDRIPRKPLAGAASAASVGSVLSSHEVMSIRSRISSFLKDTIESNGGSINPDSLRGYLSDLKADLMASFSEKLKS